MKYGLVIKDGLVIMTSGAKYVDIGIDGERISAIGEHLNGLQTINAGGLIVSPGMVDAHVHLTQLGGGYRDGWEGYRTGTSAAAKGGTTTVIEMPMNQLPATIDGSSINSKYKSGKNKLKVDVASLGGVVPTNLDGGIQELNENGICGYFLSTCGSRMLKNDLQLSDDYTLFSAMKQIQKTGKVLAIHTENEAITSRLEQQAMKEGKSKLVDFANAHPVVAEVDSIRKVILLAKETGCRISITHVSSEEGVDEIIKGQREGVDVTGEVCVHYLYYNTDTAGRFGSLLKCAPPIRNGVQQKGLWRNLFNGNIDFVASDHSTCPIELKSTGNIFTDWSGVAGLQNNVDVTFDEAVNKRGMSLKQFAEITATNPACRFGLTQKGEIKIGKDADFVLIDPKRRHRLSAGDLEYRHQISPYINCNIGASVVLTILRGQPVFDLKNGVTNHYVGKFLHL